MNYEHKREDIVRFDELKSGEVFEDLDVRDSYYIKTQSFYHDYLQDEANAVNLNGYWSIFLGDTLVKRVNAKFVVD